MTVIIPTHNRPQLLERALRSVLAQTLHPNEVIVVQNGGTRDSEVVARRLQAEGLLVKYIYETRAHIAAAKNIAARLATSEYLAFLDDDDMWLPEKLERQVAYLEQHPQFALVTCGATVVDLDGKPIGVR